MSDSSPLLFTSIPRGFFAAHEVLNAVPPAVLSQLISSSLHHFSSPGSTSSFDSLSHLSSLSHLPVSSLESALSALHHIYRALTSSAIATSSSSSSTEWKSSLQTETALKEEVIDLIISAFQQHRKAVNSLDSTKVSSLASTLQYNQLIDLEWKLGVSVSSTSCSQLYEPMVTLVWKLRQVGENEGIRVETMELSLKEFRQVRTAFQEMATAMEAL